MQLFGLLGLIVTIAIGAWWLTSAGPASVNEPAGDTTTYQESIDSAKEAAEILGATPVPASTEMVEVYDGISVPKNVLQLDVSGRDLSGSLKAEIRHLEDLQSLDMSDNNFTGIPAEVGQLSQLSILDLSNNPITGLPYEIGNLSNLGQLDLRDTSYAEADLAIIKQSLPSNVVILTD